MRALDNIDICKYWRNIDKILLWSETQTQTNCNADGYIYEGSRWDRYLKIFEKEANSLK